MLYIFIAAACFVAILSGSLWLLLTVLTCLAMVFYPSLLIFLGLAGLGYSYS